MITFLVIITLGLIVFSGYLYLSLRESQDAFESLHSRFSVKYRKLQEQADIDRNIRRRLLDVLGEQEAEDK